MDPMTAGITKAGDGLATLVKEQSSGMFVTWLACRCQWRHCDDDNDCQWTRKRKLLLVYRRGHVYFESHSRVY